MKYFFIIVLSLFIGFSVFFNEKSFAQTIIQPSIDKIEHEVHFYPNPVTESKFVVQSNTGIISEIELVNILGQPVLTKKNIQNDNEVSILLNDIEKGIYLIKVLFTDNQLEIKKVIIK